MKKIFSLVPLLIAFLFFQQCKTQSDVHKAEIKSVTTESQTKKHTDVNGYTYETVANDPTGLRLYTLSNGLKVYLSRNKDEPKIQTYIAVRAGSNYDPKETTGLAHYLEHMLFKGTSKFGTQNWEEEKKYLARISDLFEAHKNEKDPIKKKNIYKKIDSVSLIASKYAIANEYDKMCNIIGATGTNAHTWYEETVYQNNIPSNELHKWLEMEQIRFSELVLRLFHTELEAVYEEFNRGQDSDYRKVNFALMDALFPTHPYGQQTTIGKAEHLKNPSMINIHKYFDKYYVPNNMAVVLVGDLDFDQTIKWVDETFGKMKNKPVDHPTLPKEKPLIQPTVRNVYGPTSESVTIGFRSKGVGSEDEKLVTMSDMILNNSVAGLIDLDLNQKQLVQSAGSYPSFQTEYGVHSFTGKPKDGQSLEEVKNLILAEIDKLKRGEFDDWLPQAVVNDLKLTETRRNQYNWSVASKYYRAFIHHQDWKDKVNFYDELSKISKQDIVNFANRFYGDNYVVVYKRKGKDKNVVKVENPKITPIHLNRDKQSAYVKSFIAKKSPDLKPVFIDYKHSIQTTELRNGTKVSYVENRKNNLFDLNFIFDMGKDHNKMLPIAIGYIKYLGTNKYTPEQIKKEFYKLGVDYGVSNGDSRSYVYISGLKKNLEKGLALIEELWDNAVPNQETYAKYVDKILKERQNKKMEKWYLLWNGLMEYGKHGEQSSLRNIYTEKELRKIDPEELVKLVKDLKNYKQQIFYYGKDLKSVVQALDRLHKVPNHLKAYPEPVKYPELNTGKKVYFVNYDMVQSEMIFLSKKNKFDTEKLPISSLFNNYFGTSMASVVFQEIRESKSLAYSAFAMYQNAPKKDQSNYVFAYIGTQANKLPQAVDAMKALMKEMPLNPKSFESAKKSALKKIAAERITKSRIFWNYLRLKDRGIDYDIRRDIYQKIQQMSLNDLNNFFNQNIKGSDYTILVVGNKKDMNMKALKKLGEVKELDIDYLLNY